MNTKYLARIGLKGFYFLTDSLLWIGYVALAVLVMTVFIDVFGRYFFNKPLMGSFELIQLAEITFGGFAIMYAAVERGHVGIDILVGRLSQHAQAVLGRVASLVGFAVWATLSYRIYLYALDALNLPDKTTVLAIQVGPFELILAFAALLCSLILLIQAFHPRFPEKKPGASEVRD